MFVLQKEPFNVQLKEKVLYLVHKNDGKKEEKCTFVIKSLFKSNIFS